MNRRLVASKRSILACVAFLAGACGGGGSEPPPGDTTAPTVQASPPGGTFGPGLTVALLCDDGGGSGCAVVRYTSDGSTPTAASPAYAAPIAVASSTQLKFFAMDNAGNASAVRTESYVVDADPPSVAAAPPGGAYAGAQSVTLSCDDGAGSGCAAIRYTTDGSTPTAASPAYAAPIAVAASATLKFFGADAVGNASAVRTESYVIDADPPSVAASPAGGAYAGAQSVTLTCDDGAGSGCAAIHYTTDGSAPTIGSPTYAAPLAVSASATIKFFGVDAVDNAGAVQTETYLIDPDPPSVAASPAGGTYVGTQTVALTCDDGAGSGCAAVHYTTDGSTPTAGSPAYGAPIAIPSSATLQFFGVDTVGNASAVQSEQYVIADPSAEIAAIRAAPDGALDLPVTGALVTYVRPAIGIDPAGFFLQADPAGPAVFVAVDPQTLSPVPAVGDRVSFTATQKATLAARVEVAAISGFAVLANGQPVEPLRADVSAVDLPPAIADYESELISIAGTISGAFAAAGAGFLAAPLATAGTPASADLVVRVPVEIQASEDLATGCSLTVLAPLWRFNQRAQATAWTPADLIVHDCPAPTVVSALATSPTSLVVTFDRLIAPASIAADGSQFTFTGGLVATGATTSGREVQVATSAQTAGQSYTVTVAGGVTDTRGTPVDPVANSASFTGYRQPALLRIAEVAPSISGSQDVVELLVLQAGTTGGTTLTQDATLTLATLPDVAVAAGDVIVVHLNPLFSGGDAPASEITAKDEYPAATYPSNHDGAWDFHGGTTGITFSNRVLRVSDFLGNTQDGVAFVRPTLATPPSLFPASLQQLQAEGHWLPADCGGALCTYLTTPSAVDVSVSWEGVSLDRSITVARVGAGDTNQASDWAVGPGTIGVP